MKSSRSRWEHQIEKVLRGQERAPLLTPFLRAAGVVMGGVIRGRNRLYDWGLLSQKKTVLPVVSIGNIVAGGTGKTPVTLLLAKELEKERRVAVLSRGYRSNAEKRAEPLLFSQGKGPLYSAEEGGDEMTLVASCLPKTVVVVGRDRVKGAALAHKAKAELILLDDGMQHRRLARDFEIVVVQGDDPFGGKRFLPGGFLRDEPSRLSRADLVVVTGELSEKVREELKKKTQAPLVRAVWQPEVGQELAGKKVALFCAIGHPSRFFQTVEKMGAQVVVTQTFPDHAPFEKERLERFAQQAVSMGAELLVCTEKDGVKLKEKKFGTLPVHPLKGGVNIVENETAWNDLVNQIKGKIR